MLPRGMRDPDLRGPAREALGQRRDEGRRLVAPVDLVDHLPRIGTQHAAEVGQPQPRDGDRDPVHEARGEPPEHGVLAVHPDSPDDVIPLGELGQQLGDLFGRILQVGVERDDHIARDVLEGREDRLVLAEIARQLEHPDAVGPLPRGLLQELERAVAAAVVDEDELVGMPRRVHDRGQPPQELRQVALLVVDRDDDGDPHRACPPRTSRTASITSS